MPVEVKSTVPKPFVFVLMPFQKAFDDIYRLGIRGAAEEVGAYAERVDEQMYKEGILDRIYNQINKADIIVADMTGKNANVFYEVGYAHALGKIVLLLTQDVNDIPFDLQHRPHIDYGGSIVTLKEKLTAWLRWGMAESKKLDLQNVAGRFGLTLASMDIQEISQLTAIPVVLYQGVGDSTGPLSVQNFGLNVRIRNTSEMLHTITHLYLFASHPDKIVPDYKSESVQISQTLPADPNLGSPAELNVRYRLDVNLPPLLPEAMEEFTLRFSLHTYKRAEPPLVIEAEEPFAIKMYADSRVHVFPFRLRVQFKILKPR